MNLDGRPHSNREFEHLLKVIRARLRDAGATPEIIDRVARHMARHEDRKRMRYPIAEASGNRRLPVPTKLGGAYAHLTPLVHDPQHAPPRRRGTATALIGGSAHGR